MQAAWDWSLREFKVASSRFKGNAFCRPWVPAIGRNKKQQGAGVPLGTEYGLGWLPVVV